MENRRGLKIQNRTNQLRNAIKRMRYKKSDEEKLKSYFIELSKRKYKNMPAKLENEMKQVNKVCKKSYIC